ncbi:transposase [Phascolarctobacterium succinatutens]|nr:transposase [Phascolarctobacterium succinatutens]UQT42836.1 transposase [Phascolarctobacterium succinatutens]
MCHRRRRFALQPLAFQARGTLGERLRPCEPPLYEGLPLLVLGWTDGNTFLPLTFCLLSTSKEKNRLNEASASVDARSNGGKQRKLAQMEAPAVVLNLLQEVKATGIPAQYVLFDTWFCSPSSLKAIHDLGYDVTAMAKKSKKVRYPCEGKISNVKAIYKEHKKRRGRSRYLLSVDAVATKQGESLVPVRLVFVRNRNKRKDYLVLVTTDLSLSEEEVIQLYGKRWGIEVFFKACKSYLRLGKDCRSVSYDAMTAHVAVVCTRYMLLAVEERENTDGRSLGELFYLGLDELPDLKYMEALRLVLQEFAEQLRAEYPSEVLLVESLLERFLNDLPALWMSRLRAQKCA